MSLKKDGFPVSEIAKQLGIGQGEVQLTLDLAERQSM
jgi:DNA-directed RNA polymerase specialized sigma24 family protein